jgi:hypothetical protein
MNLPIARLSLVQEVRGIHRLRHTRRAAAWPVSRTVPTRMAASTSCPELRTVVSRNTNPRAIAAKALLVDTSLLLDFAVAGSLQEAGGMAEFRLPIPFGLGSFRSLPRILLPCASFSDLRAQKNPPAGNISGGRSLGFRSQARLLHSLCPRRHTRAAHTTRTGQRALLCVKIMCILAHEE